MAESEPYLIILFQIPSHQRFLPAIFWDMLIIIIFKGIMFHDNVFFLIKTSTLSGCTLEASYIC